MTWGYSVSSNTFCTITGGHVQYAQSAPAVEQVRTVVHHKNGWVIARHYRGGRKTAWGASRCLTLAGDDEVPSPEVDDQDASGSREERES